MGNKQTWKEFLMILDEVLSGIKISEHDCDPIPSGMELPGRESAYFMRMRAIRAAGRIVSSCNHEDKLTSGIMISSDNFSKIEDYDGGKVTFRSPLTCESKNGVCATCFGADPQTLQFEDIGSILGCKTVKAIRNNRKTDMVIKPGFIMLEPVPKKIHAKHSGTVQFSRLEKGMSMIMGKNYHTKLKDPMFRLIDNQDSDTAFTITIHDTGECHRLDNEACIFVQDGQQINKGDVLFMQPVGVISFRPLLGEESPEYLLALFNGRYLEGDSSICRELRYSKDGITRTRILHGYLNTAQILLTQIQVLLEHRRLFVEDRYIELILREMFSYIEITDPGSTLLKPGQLFKYRELRPLYRREKEFKYPRYIPVVVGIDDLVKLKRQKC